jgi:predicted kinase
MMKFKSFWKILLMGCIKMKQKRVFLLSGPPASGKSTWVRSRLTKGSEWISRDNVRFSIVKEDEEYFSHEDEVFDTFIAYINQSLKDPDIHTIYIDATHLNKRARHKVLSRIRKRNISELNCVCFCVPPSVCQERNALREGRARVPAAAIENMFKSYTYPEIDEGFAHVYEVDADGVTLLRR